MKARYYVWLPLGLLIVFFTWLGNPDTSFAQNVQSSPKTSITAPTTATIGSLVTVTVQSAENNFRLDLDTLPGVAAAAIDAKSNAATPLHIYSIKSDGRCSMDDQGSYFVFLCRQAKKLTVSFVSGIGRQIKLTAGDAEKRIYILGQEHEVSSLLALISTDDNIMAPAPGSYTFAFYGTSAVSGTIELTATTSFTGWKTMGGLDKCQSHDLILHCMLPAAEAQGWWVRIVMDWFDPGIYFIDAVATLNGQPYGVNSRQINVIEQIVESKDEEPTDLEETPEIFANHLLYLPQVNR